MNRFSAMTSQILPLQNLGTRWTISLLPPVDASMWPAGRPAMQFQRKYSTSSSRHGGLHTESQQLRAGLLHIPYEMSFYRTISSQLHKVYIYVTLKHWGWHSIATTMVTASTHNNWKYMVREIAAAHLRIQTNQNVGSSPTATSMHPPAYQRPNHLRCSSPEMSTFRCVHILERNLGGNGLIR